MEKGVCDFFELAYFEHVKERLDGRDVPQKDMI